MSDDFVTVEVKGISELQSALEKLPPKVAKKDLRATLRAGGNVLRKAMVRNAPKDSGFLSEHVSVGTKLRSDELAGVALIGPNSKIVYPRNPKWPARTAALVARWAEFGTSKMAKKPFITQSLETTKQAVVDKVAETLREKLGLY